MNPPAEPRRPVSTFRRTSSPDAPIDAMFAASGCHGRSRWSNGDEDEAGVGPCHRPGLRRRTSGPRLRAGRPRSRDVRIPAPASAEPAPAGSKPGDMLAREWPRWAGRPCPPGTRRSQERRQRPYRRQRPHRRRWLYLRAGRPCPHGIRRSQGIGFTEPGAGRRTNLRRLVEDFMGKGCALPPRGVLHGP